MVVNLGLVVVVLFLLLALLRVPIFVSLTFPCLLYILLQGYPVIVASQRMVRMLDSFTLLAVPLFIYVGSLMNHAGITDRIFDFADSVVGHIPGGLTHVNIVASLIFSGISGSALADVGGLGRIIIDTMTDHGYDRSYSAAVTSASATVGPIFPPSIPLIIYGLVANVPVIDLLLAGIFPALLAVGLLMVTTVVIARIGSLPAGDHDFEIGRVARSGYGALPALLAPVVLIFGLLLGFFSATEAAAVTCVYVIGVNVLFYRKTSVRYVWDAAIESAQISGVILIILAAAGLFSWVMSVEGVDNLFATVLFSISTHPVVVLLIVNAFLLLLGLFLEPIGALIMSVPIVVPPLLEIGVHPVHIGVIMVFNLMIGLLTPPLGLSLFIVSDIADTPVMEVVGDLKYYYVALVLCLLAITFVPEISMVIVN